MRILLVTLEFPPFNGGIANYYGNLVRHWPLAGSLTVLDNRRGELLRPGRGGWLRAIGAIGRRIRSSRSDYLLIGQILPLGTAAWLLSYLRPLRYAVFLHGLDLSAAAAVPRRRWLARHILARAHKVIAANTYVAGQAARLFPEAVAGKVAIVTPGVTPEAPFVSTETLADMRRAYGLEGQTVLFTLGRLVKRKGVDHVLSALAALPPETIADLSYCIAGSGPDEAYLRRLVPPAWRERVLFLGGISEEEKWRWLQLCDIFIMPARDIAGDVEGFGIVYLEANLCGKPVIAGRSGGVADAVAHEVSGLLVDPEDPTAIAAAIERLAGDPALRQRLGDEGRQRAQRDFPWEERTRRLANIVAS